MTCWFRKWKSILNVQPVTEHTEEAGNIKQGRAVTTGEGPQREQAVRE